MKDSGSPSTRNPGLDLIRATAIALVLVHHLRHLPGVSDSVRWLGLRAYVGVDMFFVLSGWLIGGQFWREWQRTGTIDRLRFWKRRWLRTVPAYGAMLAILTATGWIPIERPADIAPLLFFLQNHIIPHIWLTSWSLCIEEQFYLALPLIGPMLGRLGRGPMPWLVAAGALLLSPALRWMSFAHMSRGSYDNFLDTFYTPTHMHLDGLALGVAMAALAHLRADIWARMMRFSRATALLGMLLITSQWLPVLTGSTHAATERMAFYNAVLGFVAFSLGTGLLLPWASSIPMPRPLARGLATVADHAYALYLTHEPARDLVLWLIESRGWPPQRQWMAVMAGIALAAMLLHQLVEKPALRWRDRVTTN